jgi:2-dehydro-3-deoxyphosphogluconate aldolase/(4S)-4-hydroxy-2-oxoglutarate aldolase
MSELDVDELAERLRSATVLPVLRAPDRAAALEQVQRCVAAGLPIVELTTTTGGWEQAVREVRASWPALVLGVGTVLEPEQAQAAVAAGAAFLVSPCPVPTVRQQAAVPLIEGGFTPGELLDATSRGIAKLFPAHVGGPQLLRSVLAVRPAARIVPTGGISLDAAPVWLAAGALAVGIGAGLLDHPDLAGRLSRPA